MTVWTEDRIELVRAYAADKLSASEIGSRMLHDLTAPAPAKP